MDKKEDDLSLNPKHSHDDLMALFEDGESADKAQFAEMRSNLLLMSGDHYSKAKSQFYRRVANSQNLNEHQKIRLTKNHIQKIVKAYCNNILSQAPGVGFKPLNKGEISDTKAAELHHSVWEDARQRYKLDSKIDEWCDSFVGVGEVFVKTFWDPSRGAIKGYRPKLGKDDMPMMDELGQMEADKDSPVFEGAFVFEEILGFNLIRPVEAKCIDEAQWLATRKMVDKKELMKQFPNKKEVIKESDDRTFLVFDGQSGKGGFRHSKNEVMLIELYFRPSPIYPEGWYYFFTEDGMLDDGPLPGGIFPIDGTPFDTIKTTPRGISSIKTMRPYQAEINRTASKIAEHQITLGDDKLLIQQGTKVSAGAALPGVRSINYSGIDPKVLPGRTGEQYLNYLNSQISELYSVMDVEEFQEKDGAQQDPFIMLYKAASRKRRFQRYSGRFERFLVSVAKTYLALAKIHLPDDMLIRTVGKQEQVNIVEFKNSPDAGYQIVAEPQATDVETKMGQQLVLGNVLQFAGSSMEKEDLGKLIRQMPFANVDETFNDLTMDYDSMTNNILALDRGEQPVMHEFDNHVYAVKRLVSRMRQADFKFLDPQIQQNYKMAVGLHQQAEAQNQARIQAAKDGYIPVDGPLVIVDFYVRDPNNPKKTQRARLPHNAILWLINKLESQGQSLEQLDRMNQGAAAGLADQIVQQTQGGAAPQGPVPQPAQGGMNNVGATGPIPGIG